MLPNFQLIKYASVTEIKEIFTEMYLFLNHYIKHFYVKKQIPYKNSAYLFYYAFAELRERPGNIYRQHN